MLLGSSSCEVSDRYLRVDLFLDESRCNSVLSGKIKSCTRMGLGCSNRKPRHMPTWRYFITLTIGDRPSIQNMSVRLPALFALGFAVVKHRVKSTG